MRAEVWMMAVMTWGVASAASLPFDELAAECASDVHPTTLKGLVRTESSFNPYAIGVVGGHLARQPDNLLEAISTAHELEHLGFNFSMGLSQVNRFNLAHYGETYETVFDPCNNLKVGSTILKQCYQRAKKHIPEDQHALRAALSCYYSGNFTRGFKPDSQGQPSYVQKVVANSTLIKVPPIPVVPAIQTHPVKTSAPQQESTPESKPVDTVSEKPKATTQQWVIFVEEKPTEANDLPSKSEQTRVAKAASDKKTKYVFVSETHASEKKESQELSDHSEVQQAPSFVQVLN